MREFVGLVTRGPFGTGSKSAHDAVSLKTDAGEFVLRRQGGNPFRDVELEKLVGKTICCHGEVRDYTLTMADWTECSAADVAHPR